MASGPQAHSPIDAGIERAQQLGVTRYDTSRRDRRCEEGSLALGIKGRLNQENGRQALFSQKEARLLFRASPRGEAATAAPTAMRAPWLKDSAPLPRPMSRAGVAAAVVAPPLADISRPRPSVRRRDGAERAALPRLRSGAKRQLDAVDAVQACLYAHSPARDNCSASQHTPEIERDECAGVSRYARSRMSQSESEPFEATTDGGRIAREHGWTGAILSRGGDPLFRSSTPVVHQGSRWTQRDLDERDRYVSLDLSGRVPIRGHAAPARSPQPLPRQTGFARLKSKPSSHPGHRRLIERSQLMGASPTRHRHWAQISIA